MNMEHLPISIFPNKTAIFQGQEISYDPELVEAVSLNLQRHAHSNIGPFAYKPDPVLQEWRIASSHPLYQGLIKVEIDALKLAYGSLVEMVSNPTSLGILGSGTIEQTLAKEGLLIKMLLQKGIPLETVLSIDSSDEVLKEFASGAPQLVEDYNSFDTNFKTMLCDMFQKSASPVFEADYDKTRVFSLSGFTLANLMVPLDGVSPPLTPITENTSAILSYMNSDDLLVTSFNHSGSDSYYQHFGPLWKKVFECGLGLTEEQLDNLEFKSVFNERNRITPHAFVVTKDFRMPLGTRSVQMHKGDVIPLNTSVQPTMDQASEIFHRAGLRVVDIKTVRKPSTYTNGTTKTVNNHVSAYVLKAA